MHPLARNVVIGLVALLIAGGLAALAVFGSAALAVFGSDSAVSVLLMLAAGMIAVAAGLFLFVQGWIWSQRAYRRGDTGRSVLIAIGGGLMIVLAAFALAGIVILVLAFYVG